MKCCCQLYQTDEPVSTFQCRMVARGRVVTITEIVDVRGPIAVLFSVVNSLAQLKVSPPARR